MHWLIHEYTSLYVKCARSSGEEISPTLYHHHLIPMLPSLFIIITIVTIINIIIIITKSLSF
jgi:hypothetical protein